MIEEELIRQLKILKSKIVDLETRDNPLTFVPLLAPLTGANWDGDSYSTADKAGVDLSAEFGVPAGIKAVDIYIEARDSASAAATTTCWVLLSPNENPDDGIIHRVGGLANDALHGSAMIVPCDSSGDIYVQINASGTGTMDIWIRIWGYWI